jgi:hypothetical protein
MSRRIYATLFGLVWGVNGLICKVLDIVPRHRQIVGRILSEEHALALTRIIGFSEVLMALWIISGWKWRISATVQIIVVATMNIIEFSLAPDLLLFGRWNALVALSYCTVVFYAGFIDSPASRNAVR